MAWFRRTMRRYGIELPFTRVICPRYVKTICVGADNTVDVSIERTLVFLERPELRDLRDVIPLAAADGTIHDSPDARELLRTETAGGTVVYWAPREPIVPYALYVHRHGWSASAAQAEVALYSEFHCEMRTGVAVLELSTAGAFEAAVAFRCPRWRRARSIRGLVRRALTTLDCADGERPEVLDERTRLRWTLSGPKVGERYAFVAFLENGVALWQQRLEAESLPAKLRRLVSRLA